MPSLGSSRAALGRAGDLRGVLPWRSLIFVTLEAMPCVKKERLGSVSWGGTASLQGSGSEVTVQVTVVLPGTGSATTLCHGCGAQGGLAGHGDGALMARPWQVCGVGTSLWQSQRQQPTRQCALPARLPASFCKYLKRSEGACFAAAFLGFFVFPRS